MKAVSMNNLWTYLRSYSAWHRVTRKLSKSERNNILKQLCEYGANIRQVSRIKGVSYGVIYRAKSGS